MKTPFGEIRTSSGFSTERDFPSLRLSNFEDESGKQNAKGSRRKKTSEQPMMFGVNKCERKSQNYGQKKARPEVLNTIISSWQQNHLTKATFYCRLEQKWLKFTVFKLG